MSFRARVTSETGQVAGAALSSAAGNLCPRASPEPPFTTRLVMRDVIYGHPSCREAFLEPLAHPPPIEFASRFTA